jgi:hypothetical protein
MRMSRTHTHENYQKKSFRFRDKNKLNFGFTRVLKWLTRAKKAQFTHKLVIYHFLICLSLFLL